MKSICNITMANKTVAISNETVSFDANGVGVIQSDELYNEIVNLANFFPVEEIGEPVGDTNEASKDADQNEDKNLDIEKVEEKVSTPETVTEPVIEPVKKSKK
jgi:hypothetical protein